MAKEKAPIPKEDQESLIHEVFTQEEIDDLIKEGFSQEQIAYVAKDKIQGNKITRWIGKIIHLLTWIFPFPRG